VQAVGGLHWSLNDSVSGLRTLNPDTEFVPEIPVGTTAKNVWTTTAQTVAAPTVVNSLVVGGTVTLNETLTVSSGTIVLAENVPVLGSGRIRVPGEAIVISLADIGSVEVPIEAQRLTLSGNVMLRGVNDIPGGTSIEGAVVVRAQGALGSGPIRFPYDMMAFGSVDQTVPNDIHFGPDRPADAQGRATTYFGPENFIKVESGHEVTFTGKLTGTGGIEIGGRGGFFDDRGLVRINGEAVFDAIVFSGTRGILEVNGTIRSTMDPIYIRMLAKLRGNGTIFGSVDGGDVSPGPDGLPGQMTISRLTSFEDPPTTYIADLAGSLAGEQYDRLVVRDGVALSLNGQNAELLVNLSYQPQLGEKFVIIDNQSAGSIGGAFADMPEGATFSVNGVPLQISYIGGDGNDVTLTAVPEPSLLCILLAAPMLMRRRVLLGN
jgi:hypothetical protein